MNAALPSSVSASSRPCAVCGATTFHDQSVLWPALIEAWELTPEEVAIIDRQQGRRCQECGASLRSQALAAAILAEYEFSGLFREFVETSAAQALRVLEINRAGELTPWLARLAQHELVEYPAVDMQQMPFAAGTFDLVVHSDTLEHVPDPLVGLRECRRVLRPGGRCIYTVPLLVGRATRSCAGRPPSYHGSPAHPDDCRVHTEFGADAWLWPIRAGFDACAIHRWDDPAAFALAARVTCIPQPAAADAPSTTTTSSSSCSSSSPPRPRRFRERERLRWHQTALAAGWAAGREVLEVQYGSSDSSQCLAAAARSYRLIDCHFTPRLLLPDADVDLVVCLHVLEWVSDPQRLLRELRRVLRPEGLLVISSEVPGTAEWFQPGTSAPHPLSPAEFLALLRQEFSRVGWGVQTLWNGSLLLPQEPSPDLRDFRSVLWEEIPPREVPGLADPLATVAFATNAATLPPVPWGLGAFAPDVSPHHKQIQELKSRLSSVLHSRSWKLTAPLRWVTARLRPQGTSP